MKSRVNFQEKKWAGKHGDAYSLRNLQSSKELNKAYAKNLGISRRKMNEIFLKGFKKDINILEVGANVGAQLQILQEMGFLNLYGIEINRTAIELSKSLTKKIDIIQASASDIPFKDSSFDLVFTSAALIHISPKNIKKVLQEIHRCAKKYIWGYEFYADNYMGVVWRGKKNLVWKTNFSKLYLDNFNDLKLVKEKKIKRLNDENIDVMFLLKKNE